MDLKDPCSDVQSEKCPTASWLGFVFLRSVNTCSFF